MKYKYFTGRFSFLLPSRRMLRCMCFNTLRPFIFGVFEHLFAVLPAFCRMVIFAGTRNVFFVSCLDLWKILGALGFFCRGSREIGLVPIFLFSDILPHGGGTALLRGSHKKVAEVLWAKAGTTGMSGATQTQISPLFPDSDDACISPEGLWKRADGKGEICDFLYTILLYLVA